MKTRLTKRYVTDKVYQHTLWLESGGVKGNRLTLRDVVIRGFVFDNTNLSRAVLSVSDLSGCSFRGANLEMTNLYQSLLEDADFSNANMQESFLNGAVVTRARFEGANTHNSSFHASNLHEATSFPISPVSLGDVCWDSQYKQLVLLVEEVVGLHVSLLTAQGIKRNVHWHRKFTHLFPYDSR